MSGDHNMNQFSPDWDTVRAYEDRFTELFDEVQQLRVESKQQANYKKLYEELKAETRMRFEPPPETMEYIVRYELMGHYEGLQKDLKRRQNDEGWSAIFSTDKDEDIREIKKMIKALKRVLDYYGAFDEGLR